MNYHPYQKNLLNIAKSKYELSNAVCESFLKNPRHQFIKKFLNPKNQWATPKESDLEYLYEDHPVLIYQDDHFISTISQPSFVLLMIDLLDIRSGHKILELGAGSGWNAALMAHVTGPDGLVVSLEIIPELCAETKENLEDTNNIKIICGDGTLGAKEFAPYQRGIFTAGATDLPIAFHEQIEVGGKLLFVLKGAEYDHLLVLEKKEDHFLSTHDLNCAFVPVLGVAPQERFEINCQGLKIYPKSSGVKGIERNDSIFVTRS